MVSGAQYLRGSGDHRQHMTPQHSPQPHPSATSLQPLGLSRLHQLSPSHSPWWSRAHSTPSRSAAPSPACITPHPYFYKHTPYKPPCTASSTQAMHIHHPTHMLLTIGMQVCNTRAHPAPHTTGYCCPGKGAAVKEARAPCIAAYSASSIKLRHLTSKEALKCAPSMSAV